MDATLIEVLTAIVRKWKYHKRRLDRAENKKARFSLMNRANELELRVQNETSPMPRLMLSHELIVVDEAWAEVWDAEAYHQGALDAAVEWCAAHTGFGSDVVYSLAIAEFDTSGKPELKSEAQLLIAALLNLPPGLWNSTAWAKVVLSRSATELPKVESTTPKGTQRRPRKAARVETLVEQAVRNHHKFDGGIVDQTIPPISGRDLAERSNKAFSARSADRWFVDRFGSKEAYETACLNGTLGRLLAVKEDDFRAFATFDHSENEVGDDQDDGDEREDESVKAKRGKKRSNIAQRF